MTARMRSRVIRASLALPFQIRPCRRSIWVTITVLAFSRSGVLIGSKRCAVPTFVEA
jgi:hypothetical protein